LSGREQDPCHRWTPRPDPAIHDPDRPGLRPHVHEPNHLWPWVFDQDEVWVDYWGNEHEIALMNLSYVEHVVSFCRERATRIWLLDLAETVALVEELDDPDEIEEAVAEYLELGYETDDPIDWLEQTPVISALRCRLASARQSRGRGQK
jgi:hypothetical protein